MASSKSASLTKKSKSDTFSSMKQGTLAFASAKRTNSSTNVKSSVTRRSSSLVQKQTERPVSPPVKENSSDVLEISSAEELSPAPIAHNVRKTRASVKAVSKSVPLEPTPVAEVPFKEKLDVHDKAGRYRKHLGEVKAKMGFMEPIHGEGQNRIHQILRVFDMSYEYGPCVGMTRLERWERAEGFGLNPPPEVRDILLTKEGGEDYAQCVLEGEV
ncbi:DNA polymerase delta, subunit 4-domain-containing protein [Hygrophoropsis aurantiaca]|uniref:DNA polymerase delta, subunit 4-domain-containing protein n=1 Tax=Hygrophoropsis aurantiaca TaxID=72124 RepID=A0ACB8AQH7_9AGAM|nr:DNA polymerase delta, subunit 4-domain-containing protein [Hygrophoropsis aurantiaca]